MRADNKGEGGSRRPDGPGPARPGPPLARPCSCSAIVGAALFYGDGVITPAISVLSAVEGLSVAPHLGHLLAPYVLPIAAGILIGPVPGPGPRHPARGGVVRPGDAAWFLTLAGLGI